VSIDLNLSVYITLTRILLAPALVIATMYGYPVPILLAIFLIAALTDWMDGACARLMNQVTAFGAFLDPIADKVLFFASFLSIVMVTGDVYLAVMGSMMLARELIVTFMRVYNNSHALSVSLIAKYKTGFQFAAIGYLFLAVAYPSWWPYNVGVILFFISLILSVASMLQYIKRVTYA
tara:strand:- start:10238 stop:10771 length:534 start_codon:yes stop_codon:yes gene_type:complete